MSEPAAMLRCVVDASVGIKLFVDEHLSGAEHSLFTNLALPSARFYTPDLFYIECTNVLWKYVRRAGLPREDAQLAVNRLCRLSLRRVSTSLLAAAALELAAEAELTAYDAAYAVLAQRVRAPLITADEALVRKLTGAEIDVRWLGQFS